MKIVNNHAGCCGYYPVRPDGGQWPRVLGLPAGASVHADTPGEILEELIEGYADLADGEARFAARERDAVDRVIAHQELLIRRAIEDGRVDASDPDDVVLIDVLRDIRARPISLDAGTGAAPTAWEAPIPLVVLATAYSPLDAVPVPAGNVLVIDPSDEETYLLGLRRIGALDYWSESLNA